MVHYCGLLCPYCKAKVSTENIHAFLRFELGGSIKCTVTYHQIQVCIQRLYHAIKLHSGYITKGYIWCVLKLHCNYFTWDTQSTIVKIPYVLCTIASETAIGDFAGKLEKIWESLRNK